MDLTHGECLLDTLKIQFSGCFFNFKAEPEHWLGVEVFSSIPFKGSEIFGRVACFLEFVE